MRVILSIQRAIPGQKRFALLRLEDVGPGGAYKTVEDLGRLRAIFEYLLDMKVPFQVALIPHWKNTLSDKGWYDKGIDDPDPDAYVSTFISFVKSMAKRGVLFGMHGYTHQYGYRKMPENNQNTGTGSEFNVRGVHKTTSPSYTAKRILKSIAAFQKVDLQPAFWETPHYNNTFEQEKIFQSFIGVLYQPDVENRAQNELYFSEEENTFGGRTLGAVFVPTPLDYIHEENTVEQVVGKLGDFIGLASVFYHPYLEFEYLQPVLDETGKPEVREGLPVYQYKSGAETKLQRLIKGVRQRGYEWASLYERVPFMPAHRIKLPPDSGQLLFGDVDGDGKDEPVFQRNGQILIIKDTYQLPRNRPPATPKVWLKQCFSSQDQLLLADINGDGRDDLVQYEKRTGNVFVFYSTGSSFREKAPFGPLPKGIEQLQVFRDAGGARLKDAATGGALTEDVCVGDALKEGVRISGALTEDVRTYGAPVGRAKANLVGRCEEHVFLGINKGNQFDWQDTGIPFPSDVLLLCGDCSGNSLPDLLLYLPHAGTIRVYPNPGNGRWQESVLIHLPDNFLHAQIVMGDVDGDGKMDLVLYNSEEGLWQVLYGDDSLRFSSASPVYGPWARGDRVAIIADFDGIGKCDIAAYDPARQILDLSLSFHVRHLTSE